MFNGNCSRKCDSRHDVSHACAISDVTLHMLVTYMCHHSTGTVCMVDNVHVPLHNCDTQSQKVKMECVAFAVVVFPLLLQRCDLCCHYKIVG